MHPSAFLDAKRFVHERLSSFPTLSIADIGSFDVNGTLKPLFRRDGWIYTGFDLTAGPNVDRVLSSPYDWPEVPSDYFDVVVSSQVLEHVPKPWRWLPELRRIVRPGGLVYVCTPNTIGFHEYPVDCWRAWPDGIKALAEDAGLTVISAYVQTVDTTLIATKS